MNYHHSFHAGNFADVLKHVALSLILEKMHEKSSSFCVIDTHAGQGLYDLYGEAAQRTLEAEEGIIKLLEQPPHHPFFGPYLRALRAINSEELKVRFYPGSPKIAQSFLREQDQMFLSELHPASCASLQTVLNGERRTRIFEKDGYQSLKALLPPLQKRGVILVDPPYEKKDEFEQIIKALQEAVKRFVQGIYLIWYPIKTWAPVEHFQQQVRLFFTREILTVDFFIHKELQETRLNGCGLLILNPPWKLEDQLKEVAAQLLRIWNREKTGDVKITRA